MKKIGLALLFLELTLMILASFDCFWSIIDAMDDVDKTLTVALNYDGGQFSDYLWKRLSKNVAWAPMILALSYVLLTCKKQWAEAGLFLLGLVLVIALSDQVSSSVIKPLVERLRPSHEPEISNMLHYVGNYRGGRYGFVSSHAANAMGVATYLSLAFRKKWLTVSLLVWSLGVCYSRIYLGVHYVGDIIGGSLIGVTAGIWCYELLLFVINRMHNRSMNQLSERMVAKHFLIVCSIWMSVLFLFSYTAWRIYSPYVMSIIANVY